MLCQPSIWENSPNYPFPKAVNCPMLLQRERLEARMCEHEGQAAEASPEMIRAGVVALEQFSASYGAEELVTAVYRAMSSLEGGRHSTSMASSCQSIGKDG